MRNFSKLAVVALIFYSVTGCNDDYNPALDAPHDDVPTEQVNQIRTVDDALRIAEKYSSLGINGKSRMNGKTADKSDVFVVRRSGGRSSDDVLYYVVNYEDNQGFAVVAAPENVSELLAITEEGSYGSLENLENESFQYMMDLTGSYVESMIGGGSPDPDGPFIPVGDPLIKTDTVLVHNQVGPHVKVNWNQAWPENLFAPNKVAGCVPVAYAQLLTYFRTIDSIDLTYEGADITSQHLDWDELVKHVTSGTTYEPSDKYIDYHIRHCPLSEEGHTAIGRLVRQIGEITGTTYYPSGGSGTDIGFAEIKMIPYIGKTYAYGYKNDGMINALGQYGAGIMSASGFSHAWVVDGYLELGYSYIRKIRTEVDGRYYWAIDRITDDTKFYLHYNWGFAGDSNGYFLENVFDITKAYSYDGVHTHPSTESYAVEYRVYRPKN